MNTVYSIYKITNIDSGKSYIGYSQEYIKRWKVYQTLTPNKPYKRYIERSIAKEGLDKFSFEVIYQSLDRDHTLHKMEQHFIDEYNTMQPNGYNMARGGRGHFRTLEHTDQSKQKMSDKQKQNWMCPIYRNKMSKINTGRKHTEQEKLKRINSMKNSSLYEEGRIKAGITIRNRIRMAGFTEKELAGRKKTAQKLTGRSLTKQQKQKISENNHSNIKWSITFNEETHIITDNINKWAKNFGISHNVLFDALKRTNSIEVYKNKSNIITGSIKQGKFKGLLVTRSPL